MLIQTYCIVRGPNLVPLNAHVSSKTINFYVYDDYTIRAQNDEDSVLNWKTIVSSILIDNGVVSRASKKVFVKYELHRFKNVWNRVLVCSISRLILGTLKC